MLIAFPVHQWLQERTSMLRHTNVSCLVTIIVHVVILPVTWTQTLRHNHTYVYLYVYLTL